MAKLFGLEFKVLAVLGFLVTIAASTIGFMTFALGEVNANQSISDRLSKLQALSQAVFSRSDDYLETAPRSFPDYNRDLVVYYPSFMADLTTLDGLIESLNQEYFSLNNRIHVGQYHIGLRTEKTDQAVSDMHTAWKVFHSGLLEQLGRDLSEPRLEWGTAFIRQHQQQLRARVVSLIENLQTQLKSQVSLMQSVSVIAMTTLGVLALLSILWFYFGVTRRIKHAVAGCVRVSTGDFGHQIPTHGGDEIATLGTAINTLSRRARLILSLMDQIRLARTSASALEAIWNESEALFDLRWSAIYKVQDEGESIGLLHAIPNTAIRTLQAQDIRNQTMLKDVIASAQPLVISDLRQTIADHPTERLVRDVTVRLEGQQSVLLLPLQRADVVWAVLVLTSRQADTFSAEHVSLLQNLAPLFSEAFYVHSRVNPTDKTRDSQPLREGGSIQALKTTATG